jgi:secreted PhoX family phosphatase
MAAFAGKDGNTLLVRNHELSPFSTATGPFVGVEPPTLRRYDAVGIGGTTTLEVDREGKLIRQFLSLTGTVRNCAGGPTPWGSWVSCEETTGVAGDLYAPSDKPEQGIRVAQTHGYNFEVSAAADGLVRPVPLKAMGRFNHEAVAVDPRTGYVYQTEDRGDGAFYRYRPHQRGDLAGGGVLEALRLRPKAYHGADTSNWTPSPTTIRPRGRLDIEWIPVADPDPAKDILRTEAKAAGAATFARGEGIYWSRGFLYFACTSGGPDKLGQIWRLRPGLSTEETDTLELFIEVGKGAPLNNPDNLCVSPGGELVICEDGGGEQFVVGANRKGQLYRIARNALNESEFAGAAFSPDGRLLFFNIQNPGITFVVTGPWRKTA